MPQQEHTLGVANNAMNYNVKLTLWWTLFETSSNSMRSGDIMSAYVHLATGTYTSVGFAQGILGLSQLVAALPAGILADRLRRDTVLRGAAAIGLVGGSAMAAALLLTTGGGFGVFGGLGGFNGFGSFGGFGPFGGFKEGGGAVGGVGGAGGGGVGGGVGASSLLPPPPLLPVPWALYCAMALLGCYTGTYSPALESLFAESLPRGNSKMFTVRYVVQCLSSACGPAISCAFFLMLGNSWRLHQCRAVLLAGLAMMAAPLLLMCCFNDDRSVQRQRRGRGQRGVEGGGGGGGEGGGGEGGGGGGGEGKGGAGGAAAAPATARLFTGRGSPAVAPAPLPALGAAQGAAALEGVEDGGQARQQQEDGRQVAAAGRRDLGSGRSSSGSRSSSRSSCSSSSREEEGSAQAARAVGYEELPSGPSGPGNGCSVGDKGMGNGGAGAAGERGDGAISGGCKRWRSPRQRRACRSCCCCCCGPAAPSLSTGATITSLITVSDMFSALASGMTIKFFSLFFFRKCGQSPVTVSLLSLLGPLVISVFSLLAQRLSHRCGRIAITLVTRGVDVALLLCMAALPSATSADHLLLMGIHLVRSGAANCTRPLVRSLLQDHVPPRHRAKVNALDSVRAFSWSGSAALGGVLIERFGFERTFVITAAVKVLSYLPMVVLLRYVREGPCFTAATANGGISNGGCGSADVRPLPAPAITIAPGPALVPGERRPPLVTAVVDR